jgi:hypothetical protein
MPRKKSKRSESPSPTKWGHYDSILVDIISTLESARRAAAHTVNAVITATYWEIGRLIIELEQSGKRRADYGEQLLERLSADLTARFGRGFSIRNLRSFRAFYATWPIRQTLSAESERYIPSQTHDFPLPWSHYVRLLSIDDLNARQFYESEAIRGGWSVRQLDRQINSMFYQRTALSRNKASMLTKGAKKPRERALFYRPSLLILGIRVPFPDLSILNERPQPPERIIPLPRDQVQVPPRVSKAMLV